MSIHEQLGIPLVELDDFERPARGSVHWSCNGPRRFMDALPGRFFRPGDTASGLDVDGESYLWRFHAGRGHVVGGELVGRPGFWERTSLWSGDLAVDCISAAVLVVAVFGPGEIGAIE